MRPCGKPLSSLLLFMCLAQEEVGVPLGILTDGSIEKGNQDVKETNSRFVARISIENLHKNTLLMLSCQESLLGGESHSSLRVDCRSGENTEKL